MCDMDFTSEEIISPLNVSYAGSDFEQICSGESAEALLSIKNGGYPTIDEIKTEIIEDDTMDMDEHNLNHSDQQMDTEESEPIPELGPAALGLQRVGTQPPSKPNPPTQPVQVLNRRGMPARIRKKNKLFYDDILINHPHHR